MQSSAHVNLKFYTQVLLFIVLSIAILYYGRLLFIPLSFAFLICFIYYPIGIRLEKRAGRMLSITCCLALLLAFGFLLFQLLSNSILLVQDKFVHSKEKILSLGETILFYLGDLFALSLEQQKALVPKLYEDLLQSTLPIIRQTISLSLSTVAMLLIIPIFVSLILYYRELLVRFVLLAVPENQVGGFKATIHETTTTYFKFAKGMGIVYLVVGVLNSIGFLLLGLPNAVYFGVLAALLTFFPYFGILLGGTAAILVAWTTFDSPWYPLGVVAILSVVQYLENTVIFPWAVGHQLKINPLATLIAVIVGGMVWGGAGMVLFVPLAAILKILADRVEGLQPIAVLLGEESDGGVSKK